MENEYATLARQPRTPMVVEGMNYPAPVQDLIESMNAKYMEWALSESDFLGAEQDLLEAEALDAKEFKASVRAGTKDPGEVHGPKARRLVERHRILMGDKAVAVRTAAGLVSAAIKDNDKAIVLDALRMARDGMEVNKQKMLEASALIIEGREARNKGLTGLIQAAELTRSVYMFSPIFPEVGQTVLPDTLEIRVNEVCNNLDKLIEKGVLFPESSD